MDPFFALLFIFSQGPSVDPFPGRYREDLTASHDIRQKQFNEIHKYLRAVTEESASKREAYFQPDYRNPKVYERSVKSYRKALKARIGYPPPKAHSEPRYEQVAVDEYATIYRMSCGPLP